LFYPKSGDKSIIETDFQGKITANLSYSQEHLIPRNHLLGIGYLADTILVISDRGFDFYKGDDLIRSIDQPIKNGDFLQREFATSDNSIVVYTGSPFSLEGLDLRSELHSFKYFERFRAAQMIDIRSQQYRHTLPLPEESIFHHQPGPWVNMFLHLADDSGTIYFLLNPEQKIYQFIPSGDSLRYDGSIPIQLDQFVLLSNRSAQQDMRKNVVVNSMIKDLVVEKNTILVSYRSGIPEDEYYSGLADQRDQLAKTFNATNRNYLSRYVNGKKVGADLRLPHRVSQIVSRLEKDIYLGKPDFSQVEHADKCVYYLLKI
jgi:hypothetical protein